MNNVSIATKVLKLADANLPVLAIAGLIGTAGLSAVGAVRAAKYLEEEKQKLPTKQVIHEESRVSFVKVPLKTAIYAKSALYFLPAVVVGGATILAITRADSLSKQALAGAAFAYTVAEKNYKDYQEVVASVIGENKASKVREAIVEKQLSVTPMNSVIDTKRGSTLCFDVLSGRYFLSDVDVIKRAQNEFNHSLLSDGFATVNDFYYELGLPGISLGRSVGWSSEKLLELNITAKVTEEGQPCIVIGYWVYPVSV